MTTPDWAALDTFVASFAEEHHCPTVAWGVIHDGSLAHTGSVGDVDETTVFRIASMTKSFSAAATLALRDDASLRLDDPIEMYDPRLAQLRYPTSDAPAITVRDLISMTSGLVLDDPWADRHLDLTDDEFDAIIDNGCTFAEPTGTRYEYSNFGFAVLGRVVHRATGTRIQDVVTERLLKPLGMDDSTWVQPSHDRWARPRRWLDDHFIDELPPLGDGLIAPMGGIWTTVADLARWVGWLSEAFPARDDTDAGPLSRAARREMQTAQRYIGTTVSGDRYTTSGYGYGLRVIEDARLGRVVTHSGGFPGYGSNMRWLPGRGVGVIALSNTTYAPMRVLTDQLLDLLADQDTIPAEHRAAPAALDAAGRALVNLLNHWSDDDAARLFADNVALDDSFERRSRDAKQTLARVGSFHLESLTAINDARALLVCRGTDGDTIEIEYSLATHQPTIQAYTVKTPST